MIRGRTSEVVRECKGRDAVLRRYTCRDASPNMRVCEGESEAARLARAALASDLYLQASGRAFDLCGGHVRRGNIAHIDHCRVATGRHLHGSRLVSREK